MGKTNESYELSAEVIKHMAIQVFPGKPLNSYHIISDGCANLNIKLNINNNEEYILRVYLRDKEADYKEQNLAKMLKLDVPIPEVCFIGDYNNYRQKYCYQNIQKHLRLLLSTLQSLQSVQSKTRSIISRFKSFAKRLFPPIEIIIIFYYL